METTKEVNPPLALCHVSICGVSPSYSSSSDAIGACTCHIAREGQVEWTTPKEVRGMNSNSIVSHATLIL